MLAVLPALWPIFALIVIGFVFKQFGFPSSAFWPGAERLNYYCLFPALLFYNLSAAPLQSPQLLLLGGVALLCLLVGFVLLLAVQRWWAWPAARFGVMVQGGLRFNTYLGLAVVEALFQAQGLLIAAVLLALMVPVVNVLSVWSFTAQRSSSLLTMLLPVLKNPLIIACLAGVLVNLSGVSLGLGSASLLQLMSAASLPLGLLCVGAALQPKAIVSELKPLIGLCAFKLVLMPLLAWVVADACGLTSIQTTVLAVFFALPAAPTAYVLTREMQGDSHLMAATITLQTLLAALTLPLLLVFIA